MSDPEAAPPAARWAVLAAFAALVATSQVLWLAVAPVTDEAARAVGVGTGAIGDLAVVHPLVYVLLALPTGRLLDRRLGAGLAAGAVLTAAGAVLRALRPEAYGWLLAGQAVAAVGQPLVLNATTKVAAGWFGPAERTTAIAVGGAAQVAGVLVAALSAGPLVAAGGLPLLLGTHAALAVAGAAAVLLAVRRPPPYPADDRTTTAGEALRWLRGDRLLWGLAALLFVGMGTFNALATWLDTLLSGLGVERGGGALLAVTTVAGLVGAAVVPRAAARRGRRRDVLVLTTAVTAAVMPGLWLATALPGALVWLGVLLAVEGFLLLACLPVCLDWSEVEAGAHRAATATGLLLLAGNAGGAVVVLAVQSVVGRPPLALLVLGAAALAGVVLALGLPRDAAAAAGPPAAARTVRGAAP